VLAALAAARPVVGTAVGVEGIGFTLGVQDLVGETPAALAAAVLEDAYRGLDRNRSQITRKGFRAFCR
jgi:hypothetical protein